MRPIALRNGLVILAVLQGALVLVWLWHVAQHGRSWWLEALVGAGGWLLSLWLSERVWHAIEVGQLCWDGQGWQWQVCGADPQSLPSQYLVVVDMQTAMLLRWGLPNGKKAYFWLQKNWSSDRWGDFRRAVYSPARAE